jgi:hypothetical protein
MRKENEMALRATTILAAAFLCLAPVASQAALVPYSQNFETLVKANPAALSSDGWVVYGNVFTSAHVYMYGYGPFPAPNGSGSFCAIDSLQGGPLQGEKQLSVYSDYGNQGAHTAGNLVEANVFHEQTIGAADVGNTWTFQFDAKLGNLASPTTAVAFLKTIDPNNNYAMTNFVPVDMTAIPTTWNTYTASLTIDAGLVGQFLQFGFASTATHNDPSGVFYDNLTWLKTAGAGVPGGPRANSLELRAAAPNPFRNSTRIDYSLARQGAVDLGVFDVAGRRIATLFRGQAEAGPHAATWDGRSADGSIAPSGVYRCVLQTAADRQARSLVLSR